MQVPSFLTKPGSSSKAPDKDRGMANMDAVALSRLFIRLPPLAWDASEM